jgi:hypothetical protein
LPAILRNSYDKFEFGKKKKRPFSLGSYKNGMHLGCLLKEEKQPQPTHNRLAVSKSEMEFQ